ncbi:MAG: ribosomal protein S18-alanine N-acetyltransferase [Oscillospiraceae bacterium]|jgi:ribosomal-protein-alanine N-acetyltransferase|nr:ribosomal protein S18-alanine N-acetyltransferase [Oscillospiraceae bacterium]
MLSITTATEDDMQRIIDIERDAISPPWTHGALLGEIYRDDSFFSLVSDDGATLGFVILRHAADEGELLQIAVDKAARRNGAADALMDAALSWAKEKSLCAIYLEVRKTNEAAIALYEKHGFKQIGTRKDYFTDPIEDAAIMTVRNGKN